MEVVQEDALGTRYNSFYDMPHSQSLRHSSGGGRRGPHTSPLDPDESPSYETRRSLSSSSHDKPHRSVAVSRTYDSPSEVLKVMSHRREAGYDHAGNAGNAATVTGRPLARRPPSGYGEVVGTRSRGEGESRRKSSAARMSESASSDLTDDEMFRIGECLPPSSLMPCHCFFSLQPAMLMKKNGLNRSEAVELLLGRSRSGH